MTEKKIMEVMETVKNKVPEDKLIYLKDRLAEADDARADYILSAKLHNTLPVVLLSVFLGGLGIDRFVVGDTGMGVAKLLLGWATFGIWPLIDIFICYKRAKQKNFLKIMSLL